MAESITMDLPLPPPDADLRVGEPGLPDSDTSDWYAEAIVDLAKLPPDRMPSGSDIAVTLTVHPDQPQDLGWLWRLLAYVVGITVIADVRDVIALSLRYDDGMPPDRVIVRATAMETRAAA
jgi:hypothetical protein